MISMYSGRKLCFAALIAAVGLCLFSAGCNNKNAGSGGEGSSANLTGSITIDGSSTVYPISEAMAEEFMNKNSGVQITVGNSGTGGGFKKFSGKETDISDASRPIKTSEEKAVKAAGLNYIELPIAFDGISVVLNPQNTWATCLTVAELKKIWEPGSKVNNWKQVRPGFPDVPLKLYGPGADSGTFDYFTDAIVGEEGSSRSDYTQSEDDNTLVQGVAGDKGAMGYFGFAYYEENQDKLKLAGIDGGKGCVSPSVESINTGTYQPLARPIFIYIREDAAARPEVQAFVHFYLDKGNSKLIRHVGYVALPDQALTLALQRFNDRHTGSLFSGGSQIGVKIEDLLSRSRAGSKPGAVTPPGPAPEAAH